MAKKKSLSSFVSMNKMKAPKKITLAKSKVKMPKLKGSSKKYC